MKKALSIILCLAMLMSTVPMSVFAAPSAVTKDESASEFVSEPLKDSENAELAAEGTVMPVKVLPANGETVDRRYPVAYYTFAKSVKINAADVTLENIGNENVGGVYFEEETNTIWVFPAKPEGGAFAYNEVSYDAWTSNIAAEDGSLLSFPGVNFNLDTSIPSDGQNLVPFGNMEYGWTPFDLNEASAEGQFAVVEDPTNPGNHVTMRTWKPGESKWPHAHVDVAWTPGSTYKVKAKVMVKDFVSDSGVGGNNGNTTITPNPLYTVPSFSCTGRPAHTGQTGTVCTTCGKPVDREHATSFKDHPLQESAVSVSVSAGTNNGWQDLEATFTVRDNAVTTDLRAFSIYSNPSGSFATEFYIDDVEIYEQISVEFAVGRYTEKVGNGVRAIKTFVGETIELPAMLDARGRNGFKCTKDNYVIDGWTDGTNVYAVGDSYTVTGVTTLVPNVVPTGDGYKVNLSVPEEFEDCYEGAASISVAVGETVDLTSDEYAINTPVGYSVLGWKNADTDEFVTSVSGAKDEVFNLVAVFELRTGIMVDTAAKAAELKVGNGVGTYDETAEGLKVVPTTKDPNVVFDNLAISADEYSFVDISYILNDDLAAAGGYVYIDSELSKGVAGVKYSQGASTVSYRYDLASNDAWIDVCSSIRIDPYNNNTEFTVTGIQFVKNETVAEIVISDLTAPAISETPDTEASVASDAAYEITSVVWTPETEYFMGSTEYTAAVELSINKSGYMFTDDTVVLLNGENAEAVVSAKTATVTKTFPATEAPKAIDVTLTSADTITVNDGTLALEAVVAPVNAGDVILPTTYTWSVTGGETDIATLEGNVLTAKWNGTIEVTATPDYDPSQAKAFDIVITGQTGFNVTYEKNTGADVENMPENDRAKKEYTVSSKVPTRAGFTFAGWMTSPDADDTVTDIKVTKNTTLYAKWQQGGYSIEFNNAGDKISPINAYMVALADGNRFGSNGVLHTESVELDTEKGELIIVLNGGNDFYMPLEAGSEKAISLDGVTSIEYGFRTDAIGNFSCRLYFATKDGNGNWVAPNYATNGTAYTENSIVQSIPVDGNVNTLHKFRIDTTQRDAFDGYLDHARLDIENSNNFGGKTLYIDYVKLIGADSVEVVELDIEAPKASDVVYGLDSVNTTSDKYEVKSIKWEGPELVDGKYYAASSAYTAKVEIEAANGYALSDKPAAVTVNGEDAEITVNGNKAVITYTFPATETLEEIELRVRVAGDAAAEITTSLGTLQLEERVIAVSGADIGNYEVYWSIDPSQKRYGWVDANGLVTGNTDCDALIVTATSKYDPSVKASISIKVSGQIPEKNVYFAAGTGETVTNLPASTLAKDEYELPYDVIPERTGYIFKGWSKVLGGPVITVDNVTADTTYYAVWGYVKSDEFSGSTVFKTVNGATNTKFEDGVLNVTPSNTSINEGILFQQMSGVFGTGSGSRVRRLVTADIEYIEIKTNLAPENLELCVYVQTNTAQTGANGTLTAWNESANTRFYSNNSSIRENPTLNVFDHYEKRGDWYIYKLPTSKLKNWDNYLEGLRFNFIQRDMEDAKYVYLPYDAGFEAKFDYIRLVGRDIPVMDITGISTPEVKGEASTTATAKQSDAFKVTSVEWSPALLGGLFFGSDTEYTVTMQVEVLKGYNALSNPPARVTVNGKNATYSRINSTKATITYTFPATEDVGELALVNVNLHETSDEGTVTVTKQIFSGDDFNLDKFSASNNPTGKRWTGWSDTEGGELISGTINITEDTDYYAFYEDITGYDFSNKYHKNEKNVKVANGTAKFDGSWVIVTPDYDDSKAVLTLDGMNISPADYDLVEVIYDGSLEDANNDNKFSETFAPVLKVNGSIEVALVKAEPVIASNRVSYKYTYDLTVNGKPDSVKSFDLAPYQGKPAWAVTSVKLIPNASLEEAVEIKGVKAPETWLMPDVSATASENYEIESITWNSDDGFNDDGSYKSETEYTVTIVVKAATSTKIVVEAATIDGAEVDEAVLGADGKLTIKKTFPATAALVPFELTVADAEIKVADGSVQLVPEFSADIDVKTVKWEIVENGPEGKSATIDENGVVKAYFDGVVKVKATSNYNPLVSAEATVTITNQIAAYNVKFNSNTTSTVTNMPEDTEWKLDYALPTQIPVREGFEFAGWVKTPDGTASIVKDYITKDTTYYALWVRGGLHYEFFDANENSDMTLSVGTVAYSTVDTENGVLTFQPKISAYNSLDTTIFMQTPDKAVLFKGSDYPKLVIRMTSTMDSLASHKVYFTSKDAKGNDLVPSFSEANAVSTKVAVGPDGYTDIVIDMSNKSGWMDGYITSVRFDPIDNGASMAHLDAIMSIDYIRAVSYETSVVEVTGIDTPVAKATADTTAESKDSSKYVVTNVEWEGGLIYDYYFGGETEYTVAVTVKGAPGYFVSDAPTKATVNGKKTEDFSYNAETGELTIKYKFPATGAVDNDTAYVLTLVGKDNAGVEVAEARTIFEGTKFELGTYLPKNIPSGKRWIGWSEDENATENTADDVITITENMTYYAVFEDLVEFDYSNFYHQFGTTIKSGSGELAFEDGLAVVYPEKLESDAAIITPSMNVAGKDFGFVEVYYSATLNSYNNGQRYDNLFSSALKPVLKFSTTSAPEDYSGVGTLVKSEKETYNGKTFTKYIYDMSGINEWTSANIAGLYLDPYDGFPNWGVGLIRLVKKDTVSDVAEIKVTAPETWMTPDTADNVTISDKFEVVSLEWTPASTVFAADTSYTAKVTYKPLAGYKLNGAAATINGETATVSANSNGTYTATYVFEATEALKNVKVVISGKNEIKSKGRYLDLVAETVALDGSKLPVTDVTWSVKSKGTSTELATVSENGRIYPISNGTVIVTATSVYNPKVSATHEVKISNQADLVKVTFDKNTHADVQGMPEAVYVYGKFEPENYNITRDGFFFAGWSVDEDALTPDKSFNITEDTTLYAKWGAGYEWSFDNAATSLPATGRDVSYENGIATFGPANDGSSQILGEGSGFEKLGIDTATHQAIEIRISLPAASQVKYYLRSSDEKGASLSPWNESANTNSISQEVYRENKPGEFQVITYNLGNHANWNMYPYVNRIRLDLPQAGPGAGAQIDYIRLLTSERSVKFDGNGGLIPLYGGEVTSFKETYNTGSINLPAEPTREGYEFLGWAKKTEGYTKLYNGKFTVSDDVILYAIWTPGAVLNEETVAAEGAEVTANEDGTVTVTSDEETTVTVAVADLMEVGENQTIVVKVDAANFAGGDVVLTFVDEDGTPHEVVINDSDISEDGTIIADLSGEGFEGTVTDVELEFEGTGSVTIETVAFASEENAKVFDEEGEKKTTSINTTITVVQGGKPAEHPGHISYPSTGGGSVTEHKTSTSKDPADKKVNVPARPKDEEAPAGNTPGTTTPTKPSTPSKFAFAKTYDGRFTDVTNANWFYGDVEKSYKLGLMNGKSDTEFAPEGTVTLAEAITVAARIRAIYYGDTIAQGTGSNWYAPYVEYATKKAIITSSQYSDYNALATREQVANMFVRALPGSWYTEMNLFKTIPDVPASSASFAAIQRLYNAGVVTGVDSAYNFKPAENIKRSELSAIINRVALPDSRLRVVTEDEKNNKDKKFGADVLAATVTPGNCVDKEWTINSDGYPTATPAKPDPVVSGLHNLMGGTLNADEYKTITVVLTSSKASEMVGQQAQLFFSVDGTLSESNSLRAKVEKAADGTLVVKFDGKSNAGWKGDMTVVRFDPWNKDADFSLISVTFAP